MDDNTKTTPNPNEILKEIVNVYFEKRIGSRIHKKEVESYVSNCYYNETNKEIRCTKDTLHALMNEKYGKQEKGYWNNIRFKYSE